MTADTVHGLSWNTWSFICTILSCRFCNSPSWVCFCIHWENSFSAKKVKSLPVLFEIALTCVFGLAQLLCQWLQRAIYRQTWSTFEVQLEGCSRFWARQTKTQITCSRASCMQLQQSIQTISWYVPSMDRGMYVIPQLWPTYPVSFRFFS